MATTKIPSRKLTPKEMDEYVAFRNAIPEWQQTREASKNDNWTPEMIAKLEIAKQKIKAAGYVTSARHDPRRAI